MCAVLGDKGFEAEYFKKFTTCTHAEGWKQTEEWQSWKTVTDRHGEALVQIMVKQGKMLTQPHSKLDHADPDTKALEEHDQLEYQEVRAVTSDSVEDSTRWEQACAAEEPDDQSVGDPDTIAAAKVATGLSGLSDIWTPSRGEGLGRGKSDGEVG